MHQSLEKTARYESLGDPVHRHGHRRRWRAGTQTACVPGAPAWCGGGRRADLHRSDRRRARGGQFSCRGGDPT